MVPEEGLTTETQGHREDKRSQLFKTSSLSCLFCVPVSLWLALLDYFPVANERKVSQMTFAASGPQLFTSPYWLCFSP